MAKTVRKSTAARKSTAKSLADFKAAHDKSTIVPGKIKAGLEGLGKDGWEYEADFVKRCGVSVNDFSRFREQFNDYYVSIGGDRSGKRAWAGSTALADKMRSLL